MTKPGGTYEQRLLASLDRAAIRARDADQEMTRLVNMLRAEDVPWESIGRAIGITKQGAQQRFGA